MVVARSSVLSAVKDERMSLMKQVGASDKARLEQYFESLRQIEHQLALDMQKPDPLPACTVPADPKETKATADVPDAEKNARIFGQLLAHAIACGQTRIVNVTLGSQGLHSPGSQQTWHSLTHEEPIDEKLGYQKEVTFFINWANARFADFLKELNTYKEGDATVLDRIAILWQTDHGYARTHTMDALPIMTAGRASGRLKTGMHIALPGDPATRVGLTMQQVMGVPVKDWGTLSNQTSKTVTDLVA
jgi:hypothetical protein